MLQCHSKFLVQLHMLHLDKYGITSLFLFFGQNINTAYVSYVSELFNVKKIIFDKNVT